jgi:uncharacterized YigZ family protein
VNLFSDSYRTIEKPSKGLFRDRGSRFIALAYPVSSAEEIKLILDALRKEYHDARHHCYAYMLGSDRQVWRSNDDGEPSGSAGRPILGQINSNELTDILIVVVRYFGGTLLGVSGLINAYRTASADAISNSIVVERRVLVSLRITFPYLVMNEVMKVLKEESAEQSEQLFDSECSMVVSFPLSTSEKIEGRLKMINGLAIFNQTRSE